MIELDLTTEACTDYATFYGWNDESDQSCEEFVKQKILSSITNDLIEKRNNDALLAVQEQPLPPIIKEETAE